MRDYYNSKQLIEFILRFWPLLRSQRVEIRSKSYKFVNFYKIINQYIQDQTNPKDMLESCSLLEVYAITYISYTGIHILRSTYSSNKSYLLIALNCTTIYLGLLDFIILFSLGMGHLYHACHPQPKTSFGLVMAILFCGITFFLVPAAIFIIPWEFTKKIVIFVLMMINGYSQSYIWPGFLAIVSEKYKNQDFLLSFWVTCTNFGNILGFLICNAIILWFLLSWYYCYFVTFAYLIICSLITYLRIDEQASQQNLQQIEELNQNPSNDEALVQYRQISLKSVFFDGVVRNLSIIFAIQKSVTYGLIFWLPLYFQEIGFNNFKAYIMVCYQISSMFGSSIIGYLFKNLNVTYGWFLLPINIGLIICFIILKYVKLTFFLNFLLIAICGMLLGGSYNSVSGVIVISLTKNIPENLYRKYVGFYSDAIMAVGNITTSFTQILIGIVSSFNNTWIFLVFLIYSIGGFISVVQLIYIESKKSEPQQVQAEENIQAEENFPKNKGI